MPAMARMFAIMRVALTSLVVITACAAGSMTVLAQTAEPWMKKISAIAREDTTWCERTIQPGNLIDCFNYIEGGLGADWIVTVKKFDTIQQADADLAKNMADDTRLIQHTWRKVAGADAGGWYEFDFKDIDKASFYNEHLRRYDFRIDKFSVRIRERTMSGTPLPSPALLAPIVAILKEASAVSGPAPVVPVPDSIAASGGGMWVQQKVFLDRKESSDGFLPHRLVEFTDGRIVLDTIYRAELTKDRANTYTGRRTFVWSPPPKTLQAGDVIPMHGSIAYKEDPYLYLDASDRFYPFDSIAFGVSHQRAEGVSLKWKQARTETTVQLHAPSPESDKAFEIRVIIAGADAAAMQQARYAYVWTGHSATRPTGADSSAASSESADGAVSSSSDEISTATAVTAVVATVAAVISSLGAAVASNLVGASNGLASLGDLLKGKIPSDGFDDWKQKGIADGGQYEEKDHVAVITPPDGDGAHGEPWGTGAKDDPYRDYKDASKPTWAAPYGDGTAQSPYSDTPTPSFDHTPTLPDLPPPPTEQPVAPPPQGDTTAPQPVEIPPAPPPPPAASDAVGATVQNFANAIEKDLAKGERFVKSLNNILKGLEAAKSQTDPSAILSWKNIKDDFWSNVDKDTSELPGQLMNSAVKGGKTVANVANEAIHELKDPSNWNALFDTATQTYKDVVFSPDASKEKIGDFYKDVGKAVGTGVGHVVAHPVDTAKTLLGVDNWEKVLDPNVSVGERVPRYLFGVLDILLNTVGIGEAGKGLKALEGASEAMKAAKAAEAAEEAAKTAKLAEAAAETKKATGLENTAKEAKAAEEIDKGAKETRAAEETDGAAKEAKPAEAKETEKAPLTKEQREARYKRRDQLYNEYEHNKFADKDEETAKAMKAELDKLDAQIKSETLEAPPLDGFPHADEAVSIEAIRRAQNCNFKLVRAGSGSVPMNGADAIDHWPKGKDYLIMEDKAGNFIDARFGPSLSQGEIKRILELRRGG